MTLMMLMPAGEPRGLTGDLLPAGTMLARFARGVHYGSDILVKSIRCIVFIRKFIIVSL